MLRRRPDRLQNARHMESLVMHHGQPHARGTACGALAEEESGEGVLLLLQAPRPPPSPGQPTLTHRP